MCDPVTIGSIAVSAIGAGISGAEQNKLQKQAVASRNAATEAELIRQRGFRDQAQPIFQSAVAKQGADQSLGDLVTAQTERQGAMTGAVQDGAYQPAAPSNGVANEEVVRQVAKAAGEARDNAMRAGALGGWGDLQFGQGLGMQSVGRQMGTVSDFAGGSVRQLPGEQNAAYNNAMAKGTSGIGDILSLAGKGVGLANMAGFNPFGGASGPTGMFRGGTGTNPLTGLRYGGV